MEYADVRVLYLAHGRAGFECLRQLLYGMGVEAAHIHTLTYAREENRGLIELCNREGVALSTDSINSPKTQDRLLALAPDVVVSMHFRELIPAVVFESATFGGFNLHPSLLPKYRGCFSGVWAIIKGEEITGISYHYLNDKFDDGNIILQSTLNIADDETGYTLFNRLVDLGVSSFEEAFRLVVQDNVKGREQVGEPSYFGRSLPHDGLIDSDWSSIEIDRFVRALSFSGLDGAQVQTHQGRVAVSSMEEYRQIMERQ